MTAPWDIVLYLAPFAALIAGFALGRLTASHASRARQLESELEVARKDAERIFGELEALREEQTRYQGQVSEHIVGTADRMRDLALQYRAVYDHLAEGARELCPDRFEALGSPMETDLLTTETPPVPFAGSAAGGGGEDALESDLSGAPEPEAGEPPRAP